MAKGHKRSGENESAVIQELLGRTKFCNKKDYINIAIIVLEVLLKQC